MYILINKTKQKTEILDCGWPIKYVNALLDKGDEFIIISLYSNTIKVPTIGAVDAFGEQKWTEYKLPDLMVMMKYAADYRSLEYNL
jgi:hypothetical protein